MIQKIIRAMIGIFGFVLGFTIYSSLASTFPVLLFGIEKGTILISAVVGLIIGVIFYIIGPWVIDRFKYIAKLMDKEISKYPAIQKKKKNWLRIALKRKINLMQTFSASIIHLTLPTRQELKSPYTVMVRPLKMIPISLFLSALMVLDVNWKLKKRLLTLRN